MQRNRNILLGAKKRVLNCYALSVIVYDIECWITASRMKRKLVPKNMVLQKNTANSINGESIQQGNLKRNGTLMLRMRNDRMGILTLTGSILTSGDIGEGNEPHT